MSGTTDRIELAAGPATAAILAQGAELCSLRFGGPEFIWRAGPAWPRHAPILFPIVGCLKNDELHHAGRTSRMEKHGFARHRRWAVRKVAANSCTLALTDDAETRALYPFAFDLEVTFSLTPSALHAAFRLRNPGPGVLPASLGAHPAFAWPLHPGDNPTGYRLEFAEPEPEPIRRLQDGLVRPMPVPTPIAGRRLALDRDLFADDAIILDAPRSRSVRYLGPHGGLEVAWHGFSALGIWTKPPGAQPPGADFICIEPWAGTASPTDFDGPFETKPGLLHLPPGAERSLGLSIAPIGLCLENVAQDA